MGTRSKKNRRAVAARERTKQQSTSVRALKTTAIIQSRSGILPPPDELERYERLEPGITNRLMVTYEKQVGHRMELENKVIDSNIKKSNFGQIGSLIISILSIGGGIWLAMNDKNIAGYGAIFIPLATLLTSFIASYKNTRDELKRKDTNH